MSKRHNRQQKAPTAATVRAEIHKVVEPMNHQFTPEINEFQAQATVIPFWRPKTNAKTLAALKTALKMQRYYLQQQFASMTDYLDGLDEMLDSNGIRWGIVNTFVDSANQTLTRTCSQQIQYMQQLQYMVSYQNDLYMEHLDYYKQINERAGARA